MRVEDDEFGQFLDATARLQQYDHPDRRELWRKRLALNARELGRLPSFAAVEDSPIQRPEPYPSAVPPPAQAPVLEMALAMRENAAGPAAAAAEALRKARQASDLNMFTILAEAAGDSATGSPPDGPLFGVPVAIKDLIAVAELPLTGGTRSLPPGEPGTDATAVARLRQAGAIVIGMTNLHELAYGITSDNPHFGRVGNPHEPSRIAGGSSGGSAAAVARGIVPIALGSDTAGSIRIPAACCGVVGLKPSYDAIPRDGAMALAWSLDHIGPFAANVADIAAAMAVLSGWDFRLSGWLEPRRAMRLVRPANFFFDILEPSVRSCIEDALKRLSDAGIEIVEREIPGLEDAAAAQLATICAEATQIHRRRLIQAPEGLGEDVRVRLEIGQFMLATDYVAAQRFRAHLRAAMIAALDRADALVTPTIIAAAPPADKTELEIEGQRIPVHTAMTRCTAPFNVTGLPAITLPCGRDRDGLPVGLQLAARSGEDAALLEVALAVERHLDQGQRG